jgi:hypothetical protein
MFRAYEYGEIFFERIEIRSRRRDPIGLESFQDEFNFCGTDVGRREVNSVWFHKGVKFRVTGVSHRASGNQFQVSGLGNQVPGAGPSGTGTGAGSYNLLGPNS